MLGIRQVHVGNDVHDPAVRLFRQALILAPVARFHVENRNMQTLCPDHGQAGISISQHEHRVRLKLRHRPVTLCDDVPHRLPQIRADRVQIKIRIRKTEILEKNAVQVVIVVLSGVNKERVKTGSAFFDHTGEPDDLRSRADDDHQFDLSVVLPVRHSHFSSCTTGSKKVSG